MSKPVLILGGGISGLGAAYTLGPKISEVYEAQSRPGGLCDCFYVGDFRFDNAVHLSFASSPVVREIFDQTEYLKHFPEALNYFHNLWIKHPIQNNLAALPTEFKIRAITDFVARDHTSISDDNYLSWLTSRYGNFLTSEIFTKYTRKYWCEEPTNLETSWIGNRLHQPKLEELLLGAFSTETPHAYYVKEMRYPKRGGYRAFLDPLVSASSISLGKQAILIDLESRWIEYSDGSRVYFQSLVNSLPLPIFINLCKFAPKNILHAATQLRATSVALTSVGLSTADIEHPLWCYLYDEDILPSRMYSPSKKSPENAPAGKSSLQFETYFTPERPLPLSLDGLTEHVLQSIVKMGITSRATIECAETKILPFGNVIFDHHIQSARAAVREFLESKGVLSVGRFGEWDYLWSDQSLLSGIRAAKTLLEASET